MHKPIIAFAQTVVKRWWWLVVGVIGGAQSVVSGVGLAPYIPWGIGLGVFVLCFVIATYLAYQDLYIHVEIEKQPTTQIPPQKNAALQFMKWMSLTI
jgi:hypothetical protein